MGVQTYSAQQRRAVNLIWAAAGEYGFEPKFLAMKTDGTPDFYMNFVIGLVYKWFGLDMLERLFDSWLGDVRQAVMDDLAWLALESTVYQKELPGRPALEELGRTTPGSSLPWNIRPPGRSGWPGISWYTPCRRPGGKTCWESRTGW